MLSISFSVLASLWKSYLERVEEMHFSSKRRMTLFLKSSYSEVFVLR